MYIIWDVCNIRFLTMHSIFYKPSGEAAILPKLRKIVIDEYKTDCSWTLQANLSYCWKFNNGHDHEDFFCSIRGVEIPL